MNGTEKRIPRAGTRLLRWAALVAAARPMNVTSPLSALSLKAPWNCVTMSAQNPRRGGRMVGILHEPRAAPPIAYSRTDGVPIPGRRRKKREGAVGRALSVGFH